MPDTDPRQFSIPRASPTFLPSEPIERNLTPQIMTSPIGSSIEPPTISLMVHRNQRPEQSCSSTISFRQTSQGDIPLWETHTPSSQPGWPNYQLAPRYGSPTGSLTPFSDWDRYMQPFPCSGYHYESLNGSMESSCPRTIPMFNIRKQEQETKSYHPSVYEVEPSKFESAEPSSDTFNDSFDQCPDGYGEHYLGARSPSYEHYVTAPYPLESLMEVEEELCDGSPPIDEAYQRYTTLGNNRNKDEPYAQLIYRALLQAPNYTMVLRDIYKWFERNTDKGANKATRGWQNSIRHNLSMNGAFEKVELSEEDKKGYKWRLTQDAIRNGVKSTTRFRTKLANKKTYIHDLAPSRQTSRLRDGQVTKASSGRLRRSARHNRSAPKSQAPMPELGSPSIRYHPYRSPTPMFFDDETARNVQGTPEHYTGGLGMDEEVLSYASYQDLGSWSCPTTPESGATPEMTDMVDGYPYDFGSAEEPLFYTSPGSENVPMSPQTPPALYMDTCASANTPTTSFANLRM